MFTGIIQAVGKISRIEPLQQGVRLAERHQHRMLGPLLSNLSDLICLEGLSAEGLKTGERALAENLKTYGEGHWRVAQARVLCAYCQSQLGETTATPAALTAELHVMELRWGTNTLYVQRARMQLRRVFAQQSPRGEGSGKALDTVPAMAGFERDISP